MTVKNGKQSTVKKTTKETHILNESSAFVFLYYSHNHCVQSFSRHYTYIYIKIFVYSENSLLIIKTALYTNH